MSDETSKFDALVKQWDDYLETDRPLVEGLLLAQQMRDRIEALTAEVDRLKQKVVMLSLAVDQFRRVNDGLQDAMLAVEARLEICEMPAPH
jgi:uncharacterized protein (DUF2164 family)